MTFRIEFLDGTVPAEMLSPGEIASFGKITIGVFSERLTFPIDYWEEADYKAQWIEGVERLLAGNSKSALITEMYNPENPRFALMWWPLYREGDKIYIRNGYLPYERIRSPFSLEEVYSCINERDAAAQLKDETKVSEWTVSLSELEDWLQHLKRG